MLEIMKNYSQINRAAEFLMKNDFAKQREKNIPRYESEYNNPSLSISYSIATKFGEALPYSIDYMQPEFIWSGIAFIEQFGVDKDPIFKPEDRRSFFNFMYNDNASRTTAIHMAMCYFLQQMLMKEMKVPSIDDLNNGYFYKEFNKLTNDHSHTKSLSKIFDNLVSYYFRIDKLDDNEKRREELKKVYLDMTRNISCVLQETPSRYDLAFEYVLSKNNCHDFALYGNDFSSINEAIRDYKLFSSGFDIHKSHPGAVCKKLSR